MKEKVQSNHNAPFQTIKNAAEITGLSECWIRSGCQKGTVPHIMSGKKYYVNIPALVRLLNEPEDADE